jgi:uncharacterized protein (TIGR03435 family)
MANRIGTAAVALSFSLLLTSVPSRAQTVSYVASVKPNSAVDARSLSEYQPGGRFTATAITVLQLLRIAYRIQPYQIVGAPSWISTRRYDIEAKVEGAPPPSQQTLLRAILKDRFNLAIRNETRDLPIFTLVLARSDEKLGPQLTKSDFDCAAIPGLATRSAGARPHSSLRHQNRLGSAIRQSHLDDSTRHRPGTIGQSIHDRQDGPGGCLRR